MPTLPIIKITLAGLAFAMSNYQQIAKISIIPLILATPFLLVLPDLLTTMEQVFRGAKFDYQALPSNTLLYSLLFSYAYLSLSISVYRLVILGGDDVKIMPILDIKKILKLLALTLFIGFVSFLPAAITGLAFLQAVVYFLLIPMTLNFINIAISHPIIFRIKLPLPVQINLFIIQVIIPAAITLTIAQINIEALNFLAKAALFYWTAITLTLCHQAIFHNQPSK